jgi:hypothetical protein
MVLSAIPAGSVLVAGSALLTGSRYYLALGSEYYRHYSFNGLRRLGQSKARLKHVMYSRPLSNR